MRFSLTVLSPGWLALAAVLPIVVLISYRSLAGLGRVRRWIALGTRLALLSLLILALADTQLAWRSDRQCTLFLLDQSLSIPPEQSEAALDWINRAIRRRENQEDWAGLIVFAKDAKIELAPYAYPREREVVVSSQLDRQATDIATATRLALGAFPPDTGRRIVLVSDGNQNRGDALVQAAAAREAGVPMDVVPIEYRYESEILVDKISIPSDLKKGDTANLKIVVRSARPASGVLRLTRTAEGAPPQTIVEERVSLREGLNVFTRAQTIDQPDFYTYLAQFEPDPNAGDRLARNNLASGFTWIRGEGKILLVHSPKEDPTALVERMGREKLRLIPRTPDKLRENLADLRQFDAVVLSNVPAESLPAAVQEALVANTRELGAGLVMVGGPDSFGAGGYRGTVIEKALPVDMEVKSTKIRGKGALVLILHASEIPEGNFWQKKIAKLAIGALGSTDECGLLYFHGDMSWLFPLQPVGNGNRMLARIDQMAPGDMPDFDPAMKLALAALIKSDAVSKHVILISDGDPQPPSFGVLRGYQTGRISCTAVAVAAHGFGERTVMKQIAQETKGRFYDVTNPNTLPEIYIKETRVVARSLIYERSEPWRPTLAYPSEPVAGLPRSLPPIRGYVLTTAKPTAEVALTSPLPPEVDANPILAHWQYGIGKGVAFTSDLGQRWTTEWTRTDLYDKFWSQLLRWSMRSAESDALSVSTQERDGLVTVVINALDKDNDFLNFLRLKGKVIDPDMKLTDLSFRQTEPGKYEAVFPTDRAGTYLLRMGFRQPDGKQGLVSTGLSIAYPPEYRDVESNRDVLESIARVSGGELIEWKNVGRTDFFRRAVEPSRRLQDVWPQLLLLALFLLLIDVTVRRLSLDPSTIRNMFRAAWSRLRRQPVSAAAAPTLERLQARKSAIGHDFEKRRRFDAPIPPAISEAPAPQTRPSAADQAPPAKPEAPPPESSDYTDRLLKAKRRTWKEPPDSSGKPPSS